VFLDWLSSARGQQAMGRAGIPQSPINADLPDNLQEFLASTNVKVLDATAPELAEQRDAWLQWSFEYLEFSK
jgi:ABC-type Fe3+ transport system substrate-binding protein